MTRACRAIAAFAAALAVAAFAGCGAARPTSYYQIAVPAGATTPAAPGAFPVSLLIERFSAPEIYRGTDMVFRSGPEELGVYEYHRWVESPTEMLGMVLMRRLRESGRYRSVQLLRSNARGDYIVRGRLYNFEEVEGPPLVARLALELDLEDAATGRVLWSQFYAHDQAVAGKGRAGVSAVVEALDANVQQAIGELTAGLERYFASRP